MLTLKGCKTGAGAPVTVPTLVVVNSNAAANQSKEKSMSTRLFSSQIVRCFFASLGVSLILLASPAPWRASADERGTVGIVLRQLFATAQPNHRGVLAVMHVFGDSPAAKAGIHCSDFILAVNGVPVPGREMPDIMDKDIDGPVGGTVRLTVARFDGSQSEITLVRTPYPPHVNPPSDPFVYRVPGIWSNDPRVPFPVPWAPTLPYHGFVDLLFAPNFDQTDSPEYHSYVIFMSLERTHMLSAEQLQSDMVTWFRGLAVQRGGTNGLHARSFQSIGNIQGRFSDLADVRRRSGPGVQRNRNHLGYARQNHHVELRGSDDLGLRNVQPHSLLLRYVA